VILYDVIDDTIAAIASPPGASIRGIVRCCGAESLAILARVLASDGDDDVRRSSGFVRIRGRINVEAGLVVPAEVYVFRGPRSYTRQDAFEIHLPGSPVLLEMTLACLLSLGARLAEPGEFTARAYLAGGLDLSQAEAVARLIDARTDAQLRSARRMMSGDFGNRVQDIVSRLAELVALVEAEIDFVEEPIDFISPQELTDRLQSIDDDLRSLTESSASCARIDTVPRALLIGQPNAGKSTLMNRLSGLDRSICSPVSGTTRDLLSAPVMLESGEILLIDSAGLNRESSGLMSRAADLLCDEARSVDLLCVVVDLANDGCSDAVSIPPDASANRVIVGNKADLLDDSDATDRMRALGDQFGWPVCAVSAKTGDGIDLCKRMIEDALHLAESPTVGAVVALTARQSDAISNASDAIARCAEHIRETGETVDVADVLAFELREALESLGAIAGTVSTDDLLSQVFSRFCIGK
jgi:tRNA modification GTPase